VVDVEEFDQAMGVIAEGTSRSRSDGGIIVPRAQLERIADGRSARTSDQLR
jgi:hypothetical protein